jgi:peptidoglycan/xylan/chitin deacetylase (PgdA/CDA1 family)
MGTYTLDPFFTCFDWMMDVNEKAGNRIAFYFIVDHTSKTMDGCYLVNEPAILSLLRRIHDRGHEIGLHQSFNTYQNQDQTKKEADYLQNVLNDMSIFQDSLGGRQHFLRWETPITARNCAFAGLDYDSTLTYAEYAGFRCGTCYEYTFYDVFRRERLNIQERPLVVMDVSVFSNKYMNYDYGANAQNLILKLKSRCFQFNGDFTILWHNNNFPHDKAKEIYKLVVNK